MKISYEKIQIRREGFWPEAEKLKGVMR